MWRGMYLCDCQPAVCVYCKLFVHWQPCGESILHESVCLWEREETELRGSVWIWIEGNTAELSLFVLAVPTFLHLPLASFLSISHPPSLSTVCLHGGQKQCEAEMCVYMDVWRGGQLVYLQYVSECVCVCEGTMCVLWKDIWVVKSSRGAPAVGTPVSQDGAALQSS